MTYNFGNFSHIIIFFSFKVAHIDNPLLHLIKILEAELNNKSKDDGVNVWKTNPYLLWRSMMILPQTEMFGYKNEVMQQNDSLQQEPQKLLVKIHVRLSKIVKIAYITEEIHKKILDISEIQDQNPSNNNNFQSMSRSEHRKYIENLHRANKAATLIGDLLWTQKMVQFGALKCQLVTELICKFLTEYCESEFIFEINSTRPEQFTPNAWTEKAGLSIGSLMGNTMSSMLYFSGHDDAMRARAYKLGPLLGLTYQAYNDVRYFERDELKLPNWLDLGMLPVVNKIHSDPKILNYSHSEIFDTVKQKQDKEVMSISIDRVLRPQKESLDYVHSLNSYCDTVHHAKFFPSLSKH